MPLYDTLMNVVWIDRTQLLVELLPLQRLGESGISIRRTLSHCDHLSELVRNEQPDVCVMCSCTYRALASEIAMVLAFKTERCHLAVFADELTDSQIDQALSLGVIGRPKVRLFATPVTTQERTSAVILSPLAGLNSCVKSLTSA